MSKRTATNLITQAVLLPHSDCTRRGEFSPDGCFVLTTCESASRGGFARLWETQTGTPASKWIQHGEQTTAIAFSPTGDRFLTAGKDRLVRVHETSADGPRAEFSLRTNVTDAIWSQDGKSLIVAGQNKSVCVLCAATGQERFPQIKIPRAPEAPGQARPLQVSPQGRWLAVAAGVNVTLIDLSQGSLGPVLKHRLRVTDMAWRSNDRLITASDDYVIREWNTTAPERGQELYRTPRWIWSLQCSRDGQRLLIGTEDEMMGAGHPGSGHAEVMDLSTGRPVTEWLRHEGTVFAEFSPDETYVATGSADRTVAVWDIASGKRLCHHQYGWMVYTLRFSPTGNCVLAVGGPDAAIWRVP